jgi:hypothetical protein
MLHFYSFFLLFSAQFVSAHGYFLYRNFVFRGAYLCSVTWGSTCVVHTPRYSSIVHLILLLLVASLVLAIFANRLDGIVCCTSAWSR